MEEDQAVDTSEWPREGPHQRTSLRSTRRSSHDKAASLRSTSNSHASQQPSAPIAAPAPRGRLNSLVGRGSDALQSFTSPLAQIFHPLVVDEEPEELPSEGESSSPSGGTHGISYGPVTRRRLTSMTKRIGADTALPSPIRTGGHRFPITQAPLDTLEEPGGLGHQQALKTAAQTEGEEEVSGWVPPALNKRLDDIEQRQMRIEGLLNRLVESQVQAH